MHDMWSAKNPERDEVAKDEGQEMPEFGWEQQKLLHKLHNSIFRKFDFAPKTFCTLGAWEFHL